MKTNPKKPRAVRIDGMEISAAGLIAAIAIPSHRNGMNDIEWAKHQSKGRPKYKIGDVVEFHEGGFGVIREVSPPRNGWPSSYATSNVKGLKGFWKTAWHYEGDFKRKLKTAK
jgi:hypothetical protein